VTLFLKPNPSSGVPIYLQLKEQIRHAVETGALTPGDPLPPIRSLAEQLVVNANTVARVYRELDLEGLLELRHGIGAFIAEGGQTARQTASRASAVASAQRDVKALVRELREQGFASDEIRRLVEAELEEQRLSTGTKRSAQSAHRASGGGATRSTAGRLAR
jgi:GntR family transcriptional regulator